jgi:hypothetical protein
VNEIRQKNLRLAKFGVLKSCLYKLLSNNNGEDKVVVNVMKEKDLV